MSLSRDEPDGIDVQAPRLSSDTSETSQCTSFARSEWRCGERSDPLHHFIYRDKMSSLLWSHNFIWRCAVSTSEDWIVDRKAWPCRLWSICIPWHWFNRTAAMQSSTSTNRPSQSKQRKNLEEISSAIHRPSVYLIISGALIDEDLLITGEEDTLSFR